MPTDPSPRTSHTRRRHCDPRAPAEFEADRLIRAPRFSIEPNEPLELSSTRVHSVSPDHCDMRGSAIAASDAPVWVVGGGKTGMDTAHTLTTEELAVEVPDPVSEARQSALGQVM